MNENTRNEFASYGLEILKRAALLVLYENRENGNPYRGYLTMISIQQLLNIRRATSQHDNLIHGILVRLRDDGYAKHIQDEYPEHHGGGLWSITEKGVLLIED